MVEKRNIDPLGQPSDDGSFSQIQNEFEQCYGSIMDSSFAALGRTITLHLTPEKIIETSGLQAGPSAMHYNPLMGRSARRAPNRISTTRTTATRLIHRDVQYVAHIKHGPNDPDDSSGISLDRDEVQTTTVLASEPHIDEALTATIDGNRYTKDSSRIIGFQNARYVICKWTRINESENG
jgi:hypothetical protein